MEFVEENCPSIELYYPQYERVVRSAGAHRAYKVLRPVFPGYIFARGDYLSAIAGCPIRVWFVRLRYDPDEDLTGISLVPDRVIEKLKEDERMGKLVEERVVEDPYFPGRRVRIHTPMADIGAVIVRVANGNRVIVDTTLCRITVPIHQVELS